MPFPPARDHSISRQAAEALIKRFRGSPAGTHLAFMYPRRIIEELLAQPDCSGIRIYDGQDENSKRRAILVGVDKNGNDMISGLTFDGQYPCPPYCSDPP